jgi:2-polyprenyl-3-methyl-5-hydroxy-6-metoxy-1,4-benzoquinol methylase
MNPAEKIHSSYVHNRRTEVLAGWMARLAPQGARILDIGCGDGLLASRLMTMRPDLQVEGIDVLARPGTHIPVQAFDGKTIPFADGSFDAAMFVDVLHHTDDAAALMREAMRVAKHKLMIKDHTLNGFLAGPTLRFMDRVSNTRHGVRLPFNYWPKQRWFDSFKAMPLQIEQWHPYLGLYPFPANLIFERSLHFVALCGRANAIG